MRKGGGRVGGGERRTENKRGVKGREKVEKTDGESETERDRHREGMEKRGGREGIRDRDREREERRGRERERKREIIGEYEGHSER